MENNSSPVKAGEQVLGSSRPNTATVLYFVHHLDIVMVKDSRRNQTLNTAVERADHFTCIHVLFCLSVCSVFLFQVIPFFLMLFWYILIEIYLLEIHSFLSTSLLYFISVIYFYFVVYPSLYTFLYF